ncbi:hypothetical protein C6P40_002334 [Pichia californica]|uniref:Uncharacterized protein n=1 Tax=Pichia californica TaxID=460514 RepID=A0A9P6WQT1_9ASCO|nr:hypothetical protein C6P42_004897 [[Candida] californica]KAG0690583.1 hypothetical protein C6P40_002334 [[Candida] californica]
MFKYTALTRLPLITLSKRSATTISSINDKKLINLLSRLDKFDSESKIFDKLDELYLLSQRKGFFNLNANNLEFLSNSHKINDNINNLYNFNNLNRLVSNQYSNLLMIPNNSSKIDSSFDSNSINSANISPIPREGNLPDVKITMMNANSLRNLNNNNTPTNFFKPSTYPTVANSIPGLNAFMSTSMGHHSRNAPVDKYLNLLQGLARNDVELKNKIEEVLEAFNDEDDFFFNYVLEFWISGKSFNKRKAKKLQEETGNDGQLPSNLTM